MSVELHFLGWDTPITEKVREFLLPQDLSGTADLSQSIIVVPTQQSGRRLRKSLAVYCSSRKMEMFPPHVVEPSYFLKPEIDPKTVASPLEVAATWANVLMKADLSHYWGMFPGQIPSQDFLWALYSAGMIEKLRKDLSDGGYSIATIYNDFGDILEEAERWQNLSELESSYLYRLSEIGLKDPCTEKIRQVKVPGLSKELERIKRIVIAAVPDLTPLMAQYLELLSSQVPIVILVHAPESLSGYFDTWGRPLPSKWRYRLIDIPDPDENVLLCGSPKLQSRKVIEVIAQEQVRFGPSDIAIGVPDIEVIPFLETNLSETGLVSFNPAGKPADQHPLCLLLRNFRDLLTDGDYPSVAAFLRNSDLLDYLKEKQQVPPALLLEELDNYQNRHLPQFLDDMIEFFSHPLIADKRHQEFPHLAVASSFLAEQVLSFSANSADNSLRSLLQAIYQFRLINTGDINKPEDIEFVDVAGMIDQALHLIAEGPIVRLEPDKVSALEMLIWSLERERFYPEPEAEASIDLEGWMELPWNDAPFLIVSGMNDGLVPHSQPDDIFLPDTLKRQLSLPDDDNTLSVCAFQMTGLIESRRRQGRVCFIAGKTGSNGDSLRPSRLLLRCHDSELPERASRLFGTPPEISDSLPSSISFILEATPPPDVPSHKLDLKRISVTAFRDYLDCPFRFYLKNLLDMEALDDQKAELDALDFGSLMHDVLYQMACDKEIRQCEDVSRIRDFLFDRAVNWIKDRLGSSPSLQVEAQMESARQRLLHAARIQAGLIKKGWEIISWESKVEGDIDGMRIRGKVDRIDRHRQTGKVRVLDYKTSENAVNPEESHLGSIPKDRECQEYARVEVSGRQKRWTDLQLPLYAILLSRDGQLDAPFELGYFNLPKAVNDTGIVLWECFSSDLLASANRCAQGVVSDIRNRRFWPPASKLHYDNFEDLFPSEPTLCVNAESFELFMNRGKML